MMIFGMRARGRVQNAEQEYEYRPKIDEVLTTFKLKRKKSVTSF